MNRLFVDNLTVIDFSYLHSTRGIVGESWIVDVELSGELDNQGMVFDFGHVKKTLKHLIDHEVDHKLLIPTQMTGVLIEQHEKRVDIGFQNASHDRWLHRSPEDSVLMIDSNEITQESVASYLIDCFNDVLPDNVDGVSVTIRTESIEGAFYHYSHGLKKHEGNCQRIAHGHRSKIEIELDGHRSKELEALWADKFKDIYIGTQEDLVQNTGSDSTKHESCTFAYTSEQGLFELTLPLAQVYLIDTDTTVEFIANHIAFELANIHKGCAITVKAFEGVGKGAIAEFETPLS